MRKIAECPAERATYFFGGKWKIRILFNLFNKKKVRFGELKRTLSKVTQQMLSKQYTRDFFLPPFKRFYSSPTNCVCFCRQQTES